MKTQNETQNKAATMLGFVGLLLGILVNALGAIELDEYGTSNLVFFLVSFLIAICCLIMSAFTAMVAHLKPDEKSDVRLDHSYYWLTGGIAGITATIPAILFKTDQMKLTISYFILFFGFAIASALESTLISKSKHSQSEPTSKPDNEIRPKAQ
ncbi:hypothetical protein [Methanosarcina siciliae]|uniref:hypothetical protein n=1 Tax=Methanosarcina siciliae TaxID=38027 RepID=UPI00064FD60E|nr:hypothetical protein [Methanosarcina siciliae]